MQIGSGMHTTEDLLEEYAFGRLPEAEAAGLEEHLFVCEHCQTRLAEIESYLKFTKTATSELEKSEKTSPAESKGFWSGRWWQLPKPVWAIGFAGLAICLLIPFRPQPQPSTQTEVQLIASRGSAAVAHASSTTKVLLSIDADRLAPEPSYLVEVVNSDGSQVWKTQAVPRAGHLTALVPRTLAAGTYWVRVYGTPDPSHQLQEYQLDIR